MDNSKNNSEHPFVKLWKLKFKSEDHFCTDSKERFNRKQMYNLKLDDADPKNSTCKKIARKMELPVFIVSGCLNKEIAFDDAGNCIILKTNQAIEIYKP